MMKKKYLRPTTDVVIISSVHIMAASDEHENRGFSIDSTYDDTDINTKISDQNYTYNVWQQTDDGFVEVD